MLFRHLYDASLSHASYLIGCEQTREAIVIDPLRDVDRYMQLAEQDGLRLVAVAETHIPADYCSGARELALRTSARLYLSGCGGAEARYAYVAEAGATEVKERDTIDVGTVRLTVIHTPGHSPEHVSFLVVDRTAGKQGVGMLTGDFLFVGDVGRPDLLGVGTGSDGGVGTGEQKVMQAQARTLHRTLARLTPLPDYLQIWPGHGPGEVHARAINGMPQSTLGYERHVNWAFRTQTEDEFVAALLTDAPDAPQYFAVMKQMNCTGPTMLGGLPDVPITSGFEAQAWAQRSGFMVDARAADAFAQKFLPGSLNIPASRTFAAWFGSLIDYNTDVWLLADSEAQGTALTRELMRIGFDRIAGVTVAADAMAGADTTALPSRSAVALAGALGRDGLSVLDVRSRDEFARGHITGARHISLGELPHRLGEVPVDGTLVTICSNGARSAVAASLLLLAGAPGVEHLHGGLEAWTNAGYTLETPPG